MQKENINKFNTKTHTHNWMVVELVTSSLWWITICFINSSETKNYMYDLNTHELCSKFEQSKKLLLSSISLFIIRFWRKKSHKMNSDLASLSISMRTRARYFQKKNNLPARYRISSCRQKGCCIAKKTVEQIEPFWYFLCKWLAYNDTWQMILTIQNCYAERKNNNLQEIKRIRQYLRLSCIQKTKTVSFIFSLIWKKWSLIDLKPQNVRY